MNVLLFVFDLDLNGEDVIKALQVGRRIFKESDEKKVETENDMENCFGFDVSSII